MSESSKIKFFACRNSRYLAEKIAKHHGSELGNSVVLEFSDGEFQPAYDESIRGCTVFVVCSTFPPADNMMELLLMVLLGSLRLKDGAGLRYTITVNNATAQALARIWRQPLPSGCMQIKVPAD